MIKIKRLNLDSSWYIKFNQLNFILDPWLIGSEIDGFKWLNEQWHIKPPVTIKDIPNYDSIIISQNYEDHCHLETLKKLPDDKSILATEKAYSKLKKQSNSNNFTVIKICPNCKTNLRLPKGRMIG